MVESELGLIPDGWRVGSLDRIASFTNGLAMQNYRPKGDESIPVLKIKELNQGKTDENSDRCDPHIENKYIVSDGDLVFSWSGSLDAKFWTGGICGLNQHLFKIANHLYSVYYSYYWVKEHLDDFRAIARDKATTMGHIQRKHLSNALVIMPDVTIFKKLDVTIKNLQDKVILNGIMNKSLVYFRNSLLPKLMSGEIDVY